MALLLQYPIMCAHIFKNILGFLPIVSNTIQPFVTNQDLGKVPNGLCAAVMPKHQDILFLPIVILNL